MRNLNYSLRENVTKLMDSEKISIHGSKAIPTVATCLKYFPSGPINFIA